jgi:hypothetical protein
VLTITVFHLQQLRNSENSLERRAFYEATLLFPPTTSQTDVIRNLWVSGKYIEAAQIELDRARGNYYAKHLDLALQLAFRLTNSRPGRNWFGRTSEEPVHQVTPTSQSMRDTGIGDVLRVQTNGQLPSYFVVTEPGFEQLHFAHVQAA